MVSLCRAHHLRDLKQSSGVLVQSLAEGCKPSTWDPHRFSDVVAGLQNPSDLFRKIVDIDHMQADAVSPMNNALERGQRAAQANVETRLLPHLAQNARLDALPDP